MSGAFLAVGICMSATTKNQVIAFILALVICLAFVLAGSPVIINMFQSWAPNMLIDAIAALSFLSHFQNIAKGVITLNDVMFYCMSIAVWLYAAYVIIEQKKAD